MKKIILIPLLFLSLGHARSELFTEHFKDGIVKSKIEYRAGTRTDTAEGIKEGIEQIFYNSGELAYEVKNVDGKREGPLNWYDREGNHLEIIHYKKGKRHGINKTFYPSGQLRSEVNYVDDQKEGMQKEYFSNGQLARKVIFIHGKKEGIQKEYDKDGNLYSTVNYRNNYKEGVQKWFDKNGKITRTMKYEMDRPVELMKKIQAKKPEAQIQELQGLDFNPNHRKVD